MFDPELSRFQDWSKAAALSADLEIED